MSLRTTYLTSLFLGVVSWSALAALVYYLPPDAPFRLLALALIILAIGATTTPLWGRVQRRLTPEISDDALRAIALREGLWAGLFTASLIIFRISGLLDWILVLVLLALFILLENFLQVRSRWRRLNTAQVSPQQPPHLRSAPTTKPRQSRKRR